MAAFFDLTDEPIGTVLDLTSPALASELAELEERLRTVNGLLDALGRLDEVNKSIQFCSDRPAALGALLHEPFGYSRRQAEASLDMPVSWQTADQVAHLRSERDDLVDRQAGLRQRVTEVLSLHWFG